MTAATSNRKIVEASFHVRFAETDMMGIVHHANYLVYFEEGRSEYSRQFGAPYADLEAMGYSLAVSEARVRFLAPAYYDHLIPVRQWVEDIRSRSITFGYEVVDGTSGQVLATGQTKHICVDRSGHVRRIPKEWLKNFEVAAEG